MKATMPAGLIVLTHISGSDCVVLPRDFRNMPNHTYIDARPHGETSAYIEVVVNGQVVRYEYVLWAAAPERIIKLCARYFSRN